MTTCYSLNQLNTDNSTKYTNMKIHKISRYKKRDYYRRGSGVHLYTNTLQGNILLTNIKVLNTYSYQTYRIIKDIYMH